jgi:hypothetical protein
MALAFAMYGPKKHNFATYKDEFQLNKKYMHEHSSVRWWNSEA